MDDHDFRRFHEDPPEVDDTGWETTGDPELDASLDRVRKTPTPLDDKWKSNKVFERAEDLTGSVEPAKEIPTFTTSGSDMQPGFQGAVEAGHAVKADLENNLGGALYAVNEVAEALLGRLAALSGDLGAQSLSGTKQYVAGIIEKNNENMTMLQVALETLETYIDLVSRS